MKLPTMKRVLWLLAGVMAVAAVLMLVAQNTAHLKRLLHEHLASFLALQAFVLVGMALLIWRLAHYVRSARTLSHQLARTNRQLEARVADRTRKVEEGRALLHFILDTSPSEVMLAEAQSGRVHFMNHRLIERLGLQEPPQTLFLHQLLHDAPAGERLMRTLDQYGQVDGMEALIGGNPPHWSSLSARLIEVDGQLAHLLWGFDISLHKQLEEQLRELATRDALSGLLNRRAFLERGGALFDHCRRHAKPCAVLMLDIDHFKRINDQHGHQMGDEAIRACAQAIASALRGADLLGRVGGEEFAALLPLSTAAEAARIAERIREGVAHLGLRTPQGQPLALTVSIGVAQMAPGHRDMHALLADADAGLYQAKAGGRNKVQTYLPATVHPRDHITTAP